MIRPGPFSARAATDIPREHQNFAPSVSSAGFAGATILGRQGKSGPRGPLGPSEGGEAPSEWS